MSETTELPPHWHASVWPSGWDFDGNRSPDPDLKRVGYVLLPEVFYLVLGIRDPDNVKEDDPALVVTFQVREGEVITEEIYGLGVDVSEFLARITEFFPIHRWKPYAVSEILKFLALDENRKNIPKIASRPSRNSLDLRQSKHQVGEDKPPSKRHRITREHLEEVADCYAEAVGRGRPPTRAVAARFEVAHSTAAKWVGKARATGLLEQVDQHWGNAK